MEQPKGESCSTAWMNGTAVQAMAMLSSASGRASKLAYHAGFFEM